MRYRLRAQLRCLIGSAAAAFALPAVAQENGALHRALGSPDDWTIAASERVRIEAIDGQFRPIAARDDQLMSFRTVLFAEYHPGPLQIGTEVWDVRGYLTDDRASARTGEISALEPTFTARSNARTCHRRRYGSAPSCRRGLTVT